MIRFAQNHPRIIGLLLAVTISTALLGSITYSFQQVAAHSPCLIELPPVVVVGKKPSLTAQLPADSQGKL